MTKEQITSEFFMDKINTNASTLINNVEEKSALKSEIKESKQHLNNLKEQLFDINCQINQTKKEIKTKRGTIRYLNWSIFKLKRNNKKINNDYSKSKKVNIKKYTK